MPLFVATITKLKFPLLHIPAKFKNNYSIFIIIWNFMQRIALILYFVTMSQLPGSISSSNFMLHPQFVLKYGTMFETKAMINTLLEQEQKNKQDHADLHNKLAIARKNYIDAQQSFQTHSKTRDQKIKTTRKEYDDTTHLINMAYQDGYNAWWQYQYIHLAQNNIEHNLAEIDFLKKISLLRLNRLELRSQQRALTAEQELFRQQKKLAYSQKIAQENKKTDHKAIFQATQKTIKPLLDRMIKQSLLVQAASSSSDQNAQTYTKAAQTQRLHNSERKAGFAQRHAQYLQMQTERRLEKEQKDQELKILQELAIQKGIKSPIPPSQPERILQSQRDKQLAIETKDEQSILKRTMISKKYSTMFNTNSVKKSRKKIIEKPLQTSCIHIQEHDPLEHVNIAFRSLLHALRLRQGYEGHFIIQKNHIPQIEKAIENLQKNIHDNEELFHRHSTTPKISKHRQELATMLAIYNTEQTKNNNKIDAFHARAPELLQDRFTSISDRFYYYKSPEFMKKYCELERLAFDRKNKSEARTPA